MGCAASALANQSSPTPWNFCWVTLSPGVSIHPVRIPLHRMRLAANALATFLVRVANAPLDAEYGVRYDCPQWATIERMLTMLPGWPVSTKCLTTPCINRNGPRALVLN